MAQKRSAIRCAENIALLSALTLVPELSPVPELAAAESSPQDGPRRLSIEHERAVTRNLAFLSGISGRPEHVTAVAVEEDVDSRQLKVMLAINKSSGASAAPMMRKMETGMQRLLDLLGSAEDEDSPELPSFEDKIFNFIVGFCGTRMLQRIRSSQAKPLQGPHLAVHLKTFIKALKSKDFACPEEVNKEQVVSETESLVGLLEDFEAGRSDISLGQVIQGIERFPESVGESVQLDTILEAISNRSMNPSARDYLKDEIPKLAQYRKAAVYLASLARKMDIFKRSKVVPVCLDDQFFQKETIPNDAISLSECFSRAQDGQLDWTLAEACEKLEWAQSKFASKITKTHRKSRIHAEIQIVAFYDLNRVPLPPRFIFSCKDACYLCGTFIRAHGRFQSPRTHGRIYSPWRLPRGVFEESVELEFHRTVEADTRHNLVRFKESDGKLPYMLSNESSVSGFPDFSIPSPVPSTIEEEELSEEAEVSDIGDMAQAVLSPVARQNGSASLVSPKGTVHVEVVGDIVHVEDIGAEGIDGQGTDGEAQGVEDGQIEIEEGREWPERLAEVDDSADEIDPLPAEEDPSYSLSPSNTTTQIIRHGNLELIIEHEPAPSDGRPRIMPDFNLSLLQDEDLMRALRGAHPSILNVEDLPVGVDVDVGSPDMFQLRVEGEILRVNISRE